MPKYGLSDKGQVWKLMKDTANRACRDADSTTSNENNTNQSSV